MHQKRRESIERSFLDSCILVNIYGLWAGRLSWRLLVTGAFSSLVVGGRTAPVKKSIQMMLKLVFNRLIMAYLGSHWKQMKLHLSNSKNR
jgi:hypothetical protein